MKIAELQQQQQQAEGRVDDLEDAWRRYNLKLQCVPESGVTHQVGTYQDLEAQMHKMGLLALTGFRGTDLNCIDPAQVLEFTPRSAQPSMSSQTGTRLPEWRQSGNDISWLFLFLV
ncbi:Hypothetical predicted protein [Pelobates cultripes]|uniref:Uncharacterized protein n=1 Tax=Pelobates cultripes TaxID=61616 RepID=A0AAD1R538_PELCU|nr:Hypothetical predicted protein [Pelobates cultripes]